MLKRLFFVAIFAVCSLLAATKVQAGGCQKMPSGDMVCGTKGSSKPSPAISVSNKPSNKKPIYNAGKVPIIPTFKSNGYQEAFTFRPHTHKHVGNTFTGWNGGPPKILDFAHPPSGMVLPTTGKQDVSIPFTTTDSSEYYGQMALAEAGGSESVRRHAWISETPGGPPIPGRCKTTGGFTLAIDWTQDPNGNAKRYCKLKKDTQYYLNVGILNNTECSKCHTHFMVYNNGKSGVPLDHEKFGKGAKDILDNSPDLQKALGLTSEDAANTKQDSGVDFEEILNILP